METLESITQDLGAELEVYIIPHQLISFFLNFGKYAHFTDLTSSWAPYNLP